MATAKEKPVPNPTYMKDIRYFFTDLDKDHMGQLGIDLTTYDGVRTSALSVFQQTLQPGGRMPPDPAKKWSVAKSQTFRNWIANGYPRGVPGAAPPSPKLKVAAVSVRVRRDAASLSNGGITLLAKAFQGMMDKDPDDPTSYFQLAGSHWWPVPTYCLHHEPRYNPWHRAYLQKFENAMRLIEGCENVSLPYWNILSKVPAFLFKPPFDKYVYQKDVGGQYKAGDVTERNKATDVARNVSEYDIRGNINAAMASPVWERFNNNIISGHDSGHNATGPTMTNQEIAAFDPIFWFFHCNWDRLWWKWQHAADATTLSTFMTTIQGDKSWLEAPFNELPPFEDTADQTIPTADLQYVHPADEAPSLFAASAEGSALAATAFAIPHPNKVSVMVKGVNRMVIPGSFAVHLTADGKTVRKAAFFQPQDPATCESCRKQAETNFTFEASLSALKGKELAIAIEVLDESKRIGRWFPLSMAGNPSVNVRTLLQGQ